MVTDAQIDDMIDVLDKMSQRTDMFDAQARAAKVFVDAHIKIGFSRDEAMKIFTTTGSLVKAK